MGKDAQMAQSSYQGSPAPKGQLFPFSTWQGWQGTETFVFCCP